MAKRSKNTAGQEPPSLAEAVAEGPVPSAQGRARLEGWLREIARTAPGRALKRLLVGAPLQALFAGLAEHSPYLFELCRADPARLVRILTTDPEACFAKALQFCAGAVADAADEAQVSDHLRALKAEAALLIAIADIGKVWSVMRVTRALTELADAAVGSALRFLLSGAVAEGKLRPLDSARPEVGCGYIVLAMGKMGAFELNYSSDIDFIIFFDPKAPALAPEVEAAQLFIRVTRGLVRLLQQRTGAGYVFRTDLRLRPDPSSTQIAISVPAALSYYESAGQNWERAALIKARPCAGDIAAGEAFLRDVAPFIWRKYLDYAAIAEVHALKRQIHAYRGHDEIAVEGHNVKLGRGGIREIEFFVQTQQLIAGGRNVALRGRETLTMLAVLAESGWINETAVRALDAAYRFLRTVEHRLQMQADEQTHSLPSDRDALDLFARFLGFADRDDFAKTFLLHLRNVQKHYRQLFEDAPGLASQRRALAFPADEDDRDTLDQLATLGFKRPQDASAAVRRWLAGGYRALRSEVARGNLEELAPLLVDQLARSDNPDGAIGALDQFFAGLHGGARLLSLLRQNPDLITLFSLILGTAPRLAGIVAQRPEIMDGLLDPAFFGALPDAGQLAAGLRAAVSHSGVYEDLLDRARMFGQEQMFLIGTRILSGTVSAAQAGEYFARLADVLIRDLHDVVTDVFVKAHGRVVGQRVAVLALGKLGGREMTASSDLDLVVLYDFDAEHPESDGARALYGAQYFARLTQRIVGALTVRTNYGSLYEVDMRLRPSGRSGPVATSIESFRSYHESESWTWEHMALTRARVIAGPPDFAKTVEVAIRAVLCRPRDIELIKGDIVEMRRAIAEEKGDSERWNLKYVAGGLVDLEFIAQYLQLVHAAREPEILDTATARVLEKAWRLGILPTQEAEPLRAAERLYHNLTQVLRLCLPGQLDPRTAGAELLGLLARAADVPDFAALEAHLVETQAAVRASFVRILGSAP